MIGLTRGRDATWGRANGAAEGEGLSAAEPGHKGRVAFGAEAGWRVLSIRHRRAKQEAAPRTRMNGTAISSPSTRNNTDKLHDLGGNSEK